MAAVALIALGACGDDEGDSTGCAAADPAALEGKAWGLREGIDPAAE